TFGLREGRCSTDPKPRPEAVAAGIRPPPPGGAFGWGGEGGKTFWGAGENNHEPGFESDGPDRGGWVEPVPGRAGVGAGRHEAGEPGGSAEGAGGGGQAGRRTQEAGAAGRRLDLHPEGVGEPGPSSRRGAGDGRTAVDHGRSFRPGNREGDAQRQDLRGPGAS